MNYKPAVGTKMGRESLLGERCGKRRLIMGKVPFTSGGYLACCCRANTHAQYGQDLRILLSSSHVQ
jgi:hypothetical protein